MGESSHMTEQKRRTVHQWITITLQVIVAIGLALAIYEQQWMNVAITSGILILTLLPTMLGKRLRVEIPPEFELITIVFIFAAMFLGEIRGYYQRFWWWDVVLHTTSGGLLGILGVLLIYLLNESPRVGLNMKPGFVALFAFTFALAIGALWEIFEFAMDSLFGLNMQKSGLVDTMWDLIVDAIGAIVIAAAGYVYMKRGNESFIDRLVDKFIDANPRLFTRR